MLTINPNSEATVLTQGAINPANKLFFETS